MLFATACGNQAGLGRVYKHLLGSCTQALLAHCENADLLRLFVCTAGFRGKTCTIYITYANYCWTCSLAYSCRKQVAPLTAVVREAAADAASLNELDTSSALLKAAPSQQKAIKHTKGPDASQDRLIYAPEDFKLEAGVESHIDRDSPAVPEDIFRCSSCTEAACQVTLEAQQKAARQIVSSSDLFTKTNSKPVALLSSNNG